MPAKEIKELRQAGKLEEAYQMAMEELQIEPENIWGKRNICWVLYDQLGVVSNNLNLFYIKLDEVKKLKLPETETMFYGNILIVISKAIRNITGREKIEINELHNLFLSVKEMPFDKKSTWYTVFFKAFHKGFKDSNHYLEFADWWDFQNFKVEDFGKEKLPNGKEVMAIAEQAYIAYAKHLLPKQTPFGEQIFDKEKALDFLSILSKIVDDYPQFQYPGYFNAKLLLALGDKDNMLESLLPFAKKKRNDFWVWDILSEAFSSDLDKVLACYCKALSCKSPEEMLVNLRQRMAGLLISKNLFNEARTEIDLLVTSRNTNGFKIPNDVINWQSKDWYKNAIVKKMNIDFYKQYLPAAESLLFSDTPEEIVIVESVNSDKKMLNFIASEIKFGFFKYDNFLKEVKVEETLKIRFKSGSNAGIYQLYTAIKVDDESIKRQFLKEVEGDVKIPVGKSFGFLNDIFIHPSAVIKLKLSDGSHIKGVAIKSYNQEKKVWGWKLI